jgi:HD superfamily phosphohydrolase YqeK
VQRQSGIHSSLEKSNELLCLRIWHLAISAKLSKTDLGINDLDYMQWRIWHLAISAKLSKTDLGINDLDYMQWRIWHLAISAKLSKTDLGINDLDYMQWRIWHRVPHRIYLRFVNNAK